MKSRLCLAFVFLLMGSVAPRADTPLFRATGIWMGSGDITSGVYGAMLHGTCRLIARQHEAERDIELKGRCGTAAGTVKVVLRFMRDQRNKVSAVFKSPVFRQAAQFAGRLNGDEIVLSLRTPMMVDGEAFDSFASLIFSAPDKFVLREWVGPAGSGNMRLIVTMFFERASG